MAAVAARSRARARRRRRRGRWRRARRAPRRRRRGGGPAPQSRRSRASEGELSGHPASVRAPLVPVLARRSRVAVLRREDPAGRASDGGGAPVWRIARSTATECVVRARVMPGVDPLHSIALRRHPPMRHPGQVARRRAPADRPADWCPASRCSRCPRAPPAAQPRAPSTTTTYAPSSAKIANPERGFFVQHSHCERQPFDPVRLQRYRQEDMINLMRCVFYLPKTSDLSTQIAELDAQAARCAPGERR